MTRVLTLLFLLVAFIGYAQQKKTTATNVLFTIKGTPVTTDEFIYLYKKNHPNKEDFTTQKVQEYLDLFINFKLKVQEAKVRGIDTTAAFLTEYNSYKDELRKPYLPEGKIVDSLVKVTYARLQEEIKASHLLIDLKPDASPADTTAAYKKIVELKNRALQGEDFDLLASQYSEDPSARMNKGSLGYFTALQMVYPFEQAAYNGRVGEIVGPIRTRFGYHILKIEDRKPARGEVEVSHIMLRTDVRDSQSAKNLIFEIHDQLRGGVEWNELCKQYSEDPGTKNNGGKLRPFGVGAMAAVPEFDQAAFSLNKPGEISDPFQTQYGWHIIKLERKIPLPAYEESYASLKTRVSRDERVQISRTALQNKLKRDFKFNENEVVKKALFALADTTLTKGAWKAKTTSLEREELFTVNTKVFSVKEFVQYVKRTQRTTGYQPQQYIEQLYANFVEQTINAQLEAQIIRKNPEFEMLLQEYYEGILLFDVMEKEVWKKASDDSIGQHTFYTAHAKNYQAGERLSATIYSATSSEVISLLRGYVERNDSTSIKNLLDGRTLRRETGAFQKTDRPVLAQINWAKGIYAAQTNGIHYLVVANDILPPGPLSFEEARAQVISDYQEALEKQWIAMLKKKYPVKVNEKGKKYVVEKLIP